MVPVMTENENIEPREISRIEKRYAKMKLSKEIEAERNSLRNRVYDIY